MKISYNWLKNYIPNLPEGGALSDIFTFHICEVESVDKLVNGDFVYDAKVLPDRAHDLLSHRGMAKELSGILGLEYREVKYEIPEGEETNLKINTESNFCRRYMGRIVRNVEVKESPDWIKTFLGSMGQRSINNMVDASNVVMFDTGNPIHVFDLDKTTGNIIIRMAKEGEMITTLDNKEIKLGSNNLVIADDKNILAIAGVKGGKVAEVDSNTKNIIIEVANFDPTSVRKTSKAINILTDAVKRFENDLSPEVGDMAMNVMSALVLEMCDGSKIEKVVDFYNTKKENRNVFVSTFYINKRLGTNFTKEEIKNVFERMNFEYEEESDEFKVIVPTFRLDIVGSHDLVEDVIKFLGYEKIKPTLPEINQVSKIDKTFYKILWARNRLLNDGFSEVMTYVFRDKGEVEVLASASDKKFLRTNISDGLKESIKLNQLNAPFLEMDNVKVFEIGTVFFKDREEMHVAYGDKKNLIEVSLNDFCKDITEDQNLDNIISFSKKHEPFKIWSMYPFISRDIAVWMPEGDDPENIRKIIKENGTNLLIKDPYIFDSFTKDGKTSYAFRLIFQSYDRTLTDDEINEIMSKISHKISENSSWQIR